MNTSLRDPEMGDSSRGGKATQKVDDYVFVCMTFFLTIGEAILHSRVFVSIYKLCFTIFFHWFTLLVIPLIMNFIAQMMLWSVKAPFESFAWTLWLFSVLTSRFWRSDTIDRVVFLTDGSGWLKQREETKSADMKARVLNDPTKQSNAAKYKAALALSLEDRYISHEERLTLLQLRDHLGISDEEHRQFLAEAGITEEELTETKIRRYQLVLEEILEDTRVTREELQELQDWRERLEITKAQHFDCLSRQGHTEKTLEEITDKNWNYVYVFLCIIAAMVISFLRIGSVGTGGEVGGAVFFLTMSTWIGLSGFLASGVVLWLQMKQCKAFWSLHSVIEGVIAQEMQDIGRKAMDESDKLSKGIVKTGPNSLAHNPTPKSSGNKKLKKGQGTHAMYQSMPPFPESGGVDRMTMAANTIADSLGSAPDDVFKNITTEIRDHLLEWYTSYYTSTDKTKKVVGNVQDFIVLFLMFSIGFLVFFFAYVFASPVISDLVWELTFLVFAAFIPTGLIIYTAADLNVASDSAHPEKSTRMFRNGFRRILATKYQQILDMTTGVEDRERRQRFFDLLRVRLDLTFDYFRDEGDIDQVGVHLFAYKVPGDALPKIFMALTFIVPVLILGFMRIGFADIQPSWTPAS
eukprot:GFYU01001281.1.p1 GENE.GFYU01001281.1~~GFYU01001281.1.p1  ORF type:complete len:635 (+),score=226.36 GFYU01001281.1:63-1967(+)